MTQNSATGEGTLLRQTSHDRLGGCRPDEVEDVENLSTDELPDKEGEMDWSLSRITEEEEELESRTVPHEERLLAFADLYGRKTPVEIETDRNLEAFDLEMSRLPVKQKSALCRGYTVKQARLFLRIENNDAGRAAKRMARYWENRFEVLGDNAFADGHMQRRTEDDFRRVYEMALKASVGPGVDKATKRWAKMFINEWNRGHLLSLDEELAELPADEMAALAEAQKTRPDIAASDEHKLMFLRCEDFDAKRASRRMVKYWSFKFDLFGREGAYQSLTVDDLSRDHPRELSVGFFWHCQGTDTFGRDLLYFTPRKLLESSVPEQGCTAEGLLKVAWYLGHAAVEEKVSRHENGFVLLLDDRSASFPLFKPKKTSYMMSMFQSMHFDCLPMKIKAMHVFPPPSAWYVKMFLPIAKWSIGKLMRMRIWIHMGKEEESLPELEECGISRDLIPTSLGGTLDIDRYGTAVLAERNRAGL